MAAATAQQSSGRRWVVLAVGVFAQTAACAFVYGVPFLVPDLRDQFGLSLAAAGAYVAAPTAGLLAHPDRCGAPRPTGSASGG